MRNIKGFGMVEPSGIEPLTSTLPVYPSERNPLVLRRLNVERLKNGIRTKGDCGPMRTQTTYEHPDLSSVWSMRLMPWQTQRHIYFIQREDGQIKIGISYVPKHRMRELRRQAGMPCSLLAQRPGSFEHEKYLHAFYAAERLHGEWFEPSERLMDYIAALVAAAPSPTLEGAK